LHGGKILNNDYSELASAINNGCGVVFWPFVDFICKIFGSGFVGSEREMLATSRGRGVSSIWNVSFIK